ncbi:MAG: hypothetical protein WA633_04880 [Stellaceae bacterium]
MSVGMHRKLAYLASPEAYAERPIRVDTIETHYSWVFLTGRYVYKLKKPLRGTGFDFSTCEARQRNANAEVRLNRRLAPDIYLGIVPLTLEHSSGFALGGKGVVVDWLVKMVRIPAEQMLDRRLTRGDWHFADIHALAACLAKFFASARRVHTDLPDYLERFRVECQSSRDSFYRDGSPGLQHIANYVQRHMEGFIRRREDLLLERLEDRRIVEGHGDLRPEHISLGSSPRVIDCLEFRRDLRFLDPVEELAFLGMECERLGARCIAPILFHHYCRHTGDFAAPLLITFYKTIGALIRARIAILHLREKPVRDPKKWPKRAAEYLEIARRECQHMDV